MLMTCHIYKPTRLTNYSSNVMSRIIATKNLELLTIRGYLCASPGFGVAVFCLLLFVFVFVFFLSSVCVLRPLLLVSLYCLFLLTTSVFSDVYLFG